MQLDLPAAKKAIRARVRFELKKMSAEDRSVASAAAIRLLTAQGLWRNARSILLYAPLAEELDVWPLLYETIASGRIAALPRFNAVNGTYFACRIQDASADLSVGQFAIREPNERCSRIAEGLDLILVPGVAFDLRGGRIGRGAGYYDRLLANAAGVRCGVAFDQQMVDDVPMEGHDLRMNYVLTPTRITRV